jgi:hypothetical protein
VTFLEDGRSLTAVPDKRGGQGGASPPTDEGETRFAVVRRQSGPGSAKQP